MSNTRLSPFIYEEILLESERLQIPIDIKNVVTDFDIFENMNKPYLTATLILVDNSAIVENVDILGGETITLKLKSLKNDDALIITKKFYVSKIIKSARVNNATEVDVIHLIEDIAFISNLNNINKFYNGTTSSIIEKIARQFFSKSVTVDTEDINAIDVIVPNLTPIETINWLLKRTNTGSGFPVYAYSSFVDKNINFSDLGTLLSRPSINSKDPFIYSTTTPNTTLEKGRSRVIKNYQFGVTENLSELIARGYIGASYSHIDTLKNIRNSYKFDIVKDLFNKINQEQVINPRNQKYMFSEDFKVDDQSLNKFASRTITRVGGSNAFNDDLSYDETPSQGNYKLKTTARAMDALVKKSPLQIVVEGDDFIDGDRNYTIGNNIDILFHKADQDLTEAGQDIDHKRSGKYLIYSSRHMFKKERYDLSLTCVKIANNDIR